MILGNVISILNFIILEKKLPTIINFKEGHFQKDINDACFEENQEPGVRKKVTVSKKKPIEDTKNQPKISSFFKK
jgi:hypothetical protein